MSGPANTQMKQVLERHLHANVSKCVWSPKMDLLLMANIQGQASLQRHRSLQRVWQLQPPAEHAQVTGLCWRPDSNLIAVAYDTGLVLLVTIEAGLEVHRFQVAGGVTALSWQQHSEVATEAPNKDFWADYMTPLPASDKWFTESSNNTATDASSSGDNSSSSQSWHSNHILDHQSHLTLLAVASTGAKVLLYAFGYVHCATVDVGAIVPRAGEILDVQSSHNMNMLSVVLERRKDSKKKEKDVAHVTCDITALAEHHKELFLLTKKFAEIQSLLGYSTQAIAQLRETWESILLEMDTKLDAYSGVKEEGAVAADFLELLVYGYSSPEFYMFLTNKLTEKGLKKLRQTIELSYTNMHKLVVKQLEAVGQGLVFAISQVLGMARTEDRYSLLGVEEEVVNESLKEAGAFLLKTGELQQVIGSSMTDFLAFLKWLLTVHLRLSDSVLPNDLAKTTMQENDCIMNFLNDTLEEVVTDKDGNKHRKFRLETVGQYLKDEELKKPQSTSNNVWVKFLERKPEMAEIPIILPQRRKASLIQEHSKLSLELVKMEKRSVEVLSKNIKVGKCISLFKLESKTALKISQKCNPNRNKMNIIISPGYVNNPIFYLAQWATGVNEVYRYVTNSMKKSSLKIARFVFTPTLGLSSPSLSSPNNSSMSDPTDEIPIVGAEFYTLDVASFLIRDFNTPLRSFFVQVPVSSLEAYLISLRLSDKCLASDASNLNTVDMSRKVISAANIRRLDLCARMFGVSGERKVAVVIASHWRTVLLYEMEVDDEDDDEEEDNNSG